MNTRFAGYIGRAASVTGIMGILSFVSIALFFALEAPAANANPQGFYFWGTLSDIAAPLTMLPLLVVIQGLHLVERTGAPLLSRVARAIGTIGAVAITILQVLLIVRVLSFEQEVGPVVYANALVGAWLLLANYMGRTQRILPTALAWLGIAVGIAQVLYPVVFQILGGAGFYANVGSDFLVLTITSVVFLVSYIGFPIWAIWLGRVWSRQRINARAGAAYVG